MFIWDTAGEVYLCSIGKEPEPDLQRVLKPMSLLQSAEYIREKYHIPFSVGEIMDGVNCTVEDFCFHTVGLNRTASRLLAYMIPARADSGNL